MVRNVAVFFGGEIGGAGNFGADGRACPEND